MLAIRKILMGTCVPLVRRSSFKFPESPTPLTVDESKLPPRVKIDEDTIAHLERLSLVNLNNERGVQRLEEAIRFADRLSLIDTEGVRPLVSVLENEVLWLREDEVTEGGDRKLLMSSAVLTEENYYIAPPGNIPLDPKYLNDSTVSAADNE